MGSLIEDLFPDRANDAFHLNLGEPDGPPPPVPFSPPARPPVVKVRFIKRPTDNRIVKCEVFDAASRAIVGELSISDVTLSYPQDGKHPEALVRLISAWEDAYE